MSNWYAALLGLIEGLTEFIPVSSTGHLILATHLVGMEKKLADSFNVIIQLGAIPAVVGFYWNRCTSLLKPSIAPGFNGRRGLGFLILTSLPVLLLAMMIHSSIKARLYHPGPVAIGFAIGGIAILLIERQNRGAGRDLDQFNWRLALGIGLIQCLALWPGVSRSAATIVGGLLLGLNRRAATEYSFFAAIPVLSAAAAHDIVKGWPLFTAESIPFFLTGLVVAFVSAWLAISFLIRFVSHRSFSVFAWYRIALAAVVLSLLYFG